MKYLANISLRASMVSIACLSVVLAGCAPLALTAFGVGASAGVSHTLNGVTYRTFTAPPSRVRVATLAALKRMGIKVESAETTDSGELIRGSATGRQIEIELEKISVNTTRMRAIAKNGTLLYDSATATEIILQTERLLINA